MNPFVEDPNPDSERNRFKITSNVVLNPSEDVDISIVEVNIPSRLLRNHVIVEHVDTLVQRVQAQSGMNIAQHRPQDTVFATYLLRLRHNHEVVRVFTGSVQAARGDRNLVHPTVTIASRANFRYLLGTVCEEEHLVNTLNSGDAFENSQWEFVGVISLNLLFNTKFNVPPQYRGLTKRFYNTP